MKQPFGTWLLHQQNRTGWLGDLVAAAKADPDFPAKGGPRAVYERLNQRGADGEMFEAIEEAEAEWLAQMRDA